MKKRQKQGYLGPAFHHYLEYLETVEHFLITGEGKRAHGKTIQINNAMWETPKDEMQFRSLSTEMLKVDAYLAHVVRSSVKYKVDVNTLVEIADKYGHEIAVIGETAPLRLPHEWVTIVIEGWGTDDMIIVAQEQTAENHKTYPELEIDPDETFICLNVNGFRRGGVTLEDDTVNQNAKLSHFPVEIHAQHNRLEKDTKVVYAGAGQVQPTQKGFQTLDLLWRSFIVWHHQFQLQSLLRHKQVAGARPPSSFRPKRLRKKHDHPAFEHTIIQMEIDAPDPSQTGRSIFQPKKRLHQVRGFWRQYRKSGKRVWVKPHWRGDEHLGVVRRDIELITHPQESTNVCVQNQGA